MNTVFSSVSNLYLVRIGPLQPLHVLFVLTGPLEADDTPEKNPLQDISSLPIPFKSTKNVSENILVLPLLSGGLITSSSS